MTTTPVKVGDHLIVRRFSPYRGRGVELVHATVVKAPRVWLEIKEVGPLLRPRLWKMRRDTQRDDSSNYGWRFITEEQWSTEKLAEQAGEYLKSVGLIQDWRSKWAEGENLVLLADLIRTHNGLDPLKDF